MAMREQKENTGVLFKNDRKTSDRHPDYKGTANVNGAEKEVALWIKTPKNAESKVDHFYSLKFETPRARG